MLDEAAVAAPVETGDVGTDTSTTSTTDIGDYGTSTETVEQPEVQQTETTEQVETQQPTKDEDGLAEFRGSVAARFKQLSKDAPGLEKILQQFPKVRDALGATFRREAAYRELGTVQELRAFREQFPRGQDDIKEVFAELEEVQNLDKAFETRGTDGRYNGHPQLINEWFNRDREAATALFRTIPREWARLDPESYNDVMGKIVGATFTQQGIPQYLSRLAKVAEKAGNTDITEGIQELVSFVEGFTNTRRAEPSSDQRRLESERAELQRQRADHNKESAQRFNQSFQSESAKLQKDIVEAHPLLKQLPASIKPEKKADIVNKVLTEIRNHLKDNKTFMRALVPAYNKADLAATQAIQKAAWSQPWLINQYVRKVLDAETPGIVTGRQPAAQVRRPAAAQTGRPAVQGKNYKEGGRWYRPDGNPFTTEEVLRGKHLQ